MGRPPETTTLTLLNISLENLPVDDTPCIDVWDSDRLVYSSKDPSDDEVLWNPSDGFFFHKVQHLFNTALFLSLVISAASNHVLLIVAIKTLVRLLFSDTSVAVSSATAAVRKCISVAVTLRTCYL
jgi:hypothetical protein